MYLRRFFGFSSTILKFTKDHEWIRFDTASQVAKVGITNFAQQELGDIVHIELPKVGLKFAQQQSVGAIESVKVAAELYAPVGGEVIGVNEEVRDAPNLVNESAEKTWIFKAKLTNPQELDSLLTKADYDQLIQK